MKKKSNTISQLMDPTGEEMRHMAPMSPVVWIISACWRRKEEGKSTKAKEWKTGIFVGHNPSRLYRLDA